MKSFFSTVIALAGIVYWGCGTDSTSPAEDLVNSGWAKFEAQNYAGADSDFVNALAQDSSFADAYTGIGWASLKLNQLLVAQLAFTLALSNGAGDDAHAGKAYADMDLDDKASAIADVDAFITINGNNATSYTFSHDNSITQTDLLWIKAQAHFLLNQYPQAQAAVNVLAPSNNLNVGSPTYVSDLAAFIESLRTSV